MIFSNPIDLIKFEHAIFKVRFSIIQDLMNSCEDEVFKLVRETHEFIVNWHARIEDKYVFPFYGEKAKPLQNDHLLIEKYGNNVLAQRRKDWLERYIKIVLDHNRNEEELLFTQLVQIQGVWDNILSELKAYKDYEKITGLKID